MLRQHVGNSGQVTAVEPVVLAQRDRRTLPIEFEDSLVAMPYDVHMCRTVVIGIDNDAYSANPENGWHIGLIVA